MNRPDNLPEELGLNAIDEPTINGVDPSVFSIELSYVMKTKVPSNMHIKTVENAEKNPKQIQNWVDQITNLHKEKMSSNVSYSKQMPGIESLMQVWPDKIEQLLSTTNMPDERISMSIENYSMIICNMLDIPIHKLNSNKSVIEALHVLFTLYAEFKDNQHFQTDKADGNPNENVMKFY